MEKEKWEKKLSKIIKKYTKNGYFDLVDGYIPLEQFIQKLLDEQKSEIKEMMDQKFKELIEDLELDTETLKNILKQLK